MKVQLYVNRVGLYKDESYYKELMEKRNPKKDTLKILKDKINASRKTNGSIQSDIRA